MNLIIILASFLFLMLLGIITCYFKYLNQGKEEKRKSLEQAEKILEMLSFENTTTPPLINQKTKVESLPQETILYLIFNKMKNEGQLDDVIDKEEYILSAKKIIDEAYIPNNIINYDFDGYSYNTIDNKIVRKQEVCSSQQYISKMYGYSFQDNVFIINMKLGYIEQNAVYNMENKLLGKYESNNINFLLDQGTSQIYYFESTNEGYKLQSIE